MKKLMISAAICLVLGGAAILTAAPPDLGAQVNHNELYIASNDMVASEIPATGNYAKMSAQIVANFTDDFVHVEGGAFSKASCLAGASVVAMDMDARLDGPVISEGGALSGNQLAGCVGHDVNAQSVASFAS